MVPEELLTPWLTWWFGLYQDWLNTVLGTKRGYTEQP